MSALPGMIKMRLSEIRLSSLLQARLQNKITDREIEITNRESDDESEDEA